MKITTENYGFHVPLRSLITNQRMESFLDSHQDFMRETHQLKNVEPIIYAMQ